MSDCPSHALDRWPTDCQGADELETTRASRSTREVDCRNRLLRGLPSPGLLAGQAESGEALFSRHRSRSLTTISALRAMAKFTSGHHAASMYTRTANPSYQHAQYSLRASFFPALLLCAATASDGLGSSLLAFKACSNMPASKNPSDKTLAQHQSPQNLSTYIRLAHHPQVLQNLSLASARPLHRPCLFRP